MAMPELNYPYPLGGHPNGRYRTTTSQASSGAANAAYNAYMGALAAQQAAALNAFQNFTGPEPPIESAGIRTGEIVGIRAWSIGSDGLLHSMFMSNHIWQPGEVIKVEKVRVGYGEGIHAFKTIARAHVEYGLSRPVVFGEVDLWGEVIEYEYGWKAEFAAVRKLYEVRRDGISTWRAWFGGPSELTRLRKLYGAT